MQANGDADSTEGVAEGMAMHLDRKFRNFKKRATQATPTSIGSKRSRKIRDGRRASGH